MKLMSIDEFCKSFIGRTCKVTEFDGTHEERIEDYSDGKFTISILFQDTVIHSYKLSQDDFLSIFEGKEFYS